MSTAFDDIAPGAQGSRGVAGWYGKLPCLGDFASRRLPSDFIEVWDAWLQRSIATSRQQLGERWLDVFLTSPMWRFVLAPGICGEEAYAGLMLPSVDKVGRYFPLTLALPVAEADVDFPNLLTHQAWYGRLEQIGLSALNVDFSPDELESVLAESPLALAPAELSQARDLFECMRATPAAPQSFAVASIDTVPAAVHASARAIISECVRGKSYWWSVAQDTGAAEFHCSAGLPPEDYFSVLLGGSRSPETVISLDPLQALDSAGPP